jgi:aminoglycoside phosphotransferase (APT) family kinase protein
VSKSLLDTAHPIRAGEELDLSRLEPYLRERLDAEGVPIEVLQFPSGHSNLTYLVKVGDREYVLRRPPFGSKVKGAHDMGREVRVLSALSKVFPLAPEPVLYCEDEQILGAEFYLMARVRGLILRNQPPQGFYLSEEETRRACESLVDHLAMLHTIDYEAAGLAEMRKPGAYLERQVLGWAKRYEGSKTEEIPSIDKTIAWLTGNIPPDAGAVVIHNDFKFDNVVLDPQDPKRLIAVLDWEMATIGDPMTDLGVSLSYWSEPEDPADLKVVQCFLTTWPGALTRNEFAERYAEKTGCDLSNLVYYYVFGLFKLAVIVQQIYYRYHHGFTQDPRFAKMIDMVKDLGARSLRAIETEKISN